MGVAIVAQTFISIAVAVAFWRQRFEDPAMGWALRLGMIITIIGALIAGFMTHPTHAQLAAAHAGHGMPIMGAHTVGAPDGGSGLSGTGWSTEHGDLRIPHFIGLHALQVLPLIAFVMRRRRLSSDTRVRLTLTAAGSYFTLVVLLLVQALRGQPILRPDALTFGLFGAWALVTAIWAGSPLIQFSRQRTRGPSEVQYVSTTGFFHRQLRRLSVLDHARHPAQETLGNQGGHN